MEKIVAYLDFHGCLLRGGGRNRVLNRYDRKRERDRGQSAFCVPINHFSPPPYPMSRSPSCWTKPFPDPRSPHHMGQRPEFLRQGMREGPPLIAASKPVREHSRTETAPSSADDAKPLIRDGWRKLGEAIIDPDPSDGEQTIEPDKPAGPKLEYAKGSVEWQKQQEKQRLAGIAAAEEKEKRRLACIAALQGKTL
jgi:hypothetical protein